MASKLLDGAVKLLYLHEVLHTVDGQTLDLLVWRVCAQRHQDAHVVHRDCGGSRNAAGEVTRRSYQLGQHYLTELEDLSRLEEQVAELAMALDQFVIVLKLMQSKQFTKKKYGVLYLPYLP